MPDFSELGRGLVRGARDKAGQAQDQLRKFRSDDVADPPAEPGETDTMELPAVPSDGADEPEEHATEDDVNEFVAMFSEVLERHRPPQGPITQPWAIGVGDLLAAHPRVPERLRGVVRKLDRFGGISVNPEQIGFDGDEVDWDSVTEVRTRHVVDYFSADAAMDQLKSLPIPWFPGRKRVAEALGKAVLTLAMVAMEDRLPRVGGDLTVPAEVEYRGMLGMRRNLGPGMVAALVLLDPAVKGAIVATAKARGISVRPADDEMLGDATRRAEAINAKLADLRRFRANLTS